MASNMTNPFLENEVKKSDVTLSRIAGLREKLATAVEAGLPTAELRKAISMTEAQCLRERDDEANQAIAAEQQRAEAAKARAAALTADAIAAISSNANRFAI